MSRVALVTLSATYQGDVDLVAAGGQPVRLLDALNTPHRVVQGAGIAIASLTLRQPVRRNDATGTVVPCGESLALRAGAILAAYELNVPGAEREARRGAVYEQRRHVQETTRVVV